MRFAWLLFLGVTLLAVLHLAWALTVLPDRVAAHFGRGGLPDQWNSRSEFGALYAVMLGVEVAIFCGLAVLLPRLPAATINLPRKDYWLAPQRSAATRRHIAGQLLIFGAATQAFLTGAMHLTVLANRQESPRLGGTFMVLFTIYMVFTLAWVVWLILGYARRQGDDDPSDLVA